MLKIKLRNPPKTEIKKKEIGNEGKDKEDQSRNSNI